MVHILGSALEPVGTEPFVIAHVMNTLGAHNDGFARGLNYQWPRCFDGYDVLANEHKLTFGQIITASVQSRDPVRPGYVIHMIAQSLFQHVFPLSMPHLEDCICQVKSYAHGVGARVHAPRIGCGLARGRWEDVKCIIPDDWFIYTLPKERHVWPDEKYDAYPF